MRVMLDTNVIISALLFPSANMSKVICKIVQEHKMVLSSYVIEELNFVVERKFPAKKAVVDNFLSAATFDLVYTPKTIKENLFEIRDIKDYLVLYTAIIEDVDILITGDKDFDDIEIERPLILSAKEFLEKF